MSIFWILNDSVLYTKVFSRIVDLNFINDLGDWL